MQCCATSTPVTTKKTAGVPPKHFPLHVLGMVTVTDSATTPLVISATEIEIKLGVAPVRILLICRQSAFLR